MLTNQDASKLMELVQQLYQQTNLPKLPATAVSVLASLVPSDTASFNIIYEDRRVEVTHNAPWQNEEVARRLWALEKYIAQHPLVSFYDATGSSGPVRISDFLSRKQFHDLPLYQEFYKPLGVEYQISAFLPQIDNSLRVGIGVQRKQKDFSARDKIMVGCLAPHISQAYRNAQEFIKARSGLTLTEEALTTHRQGFVHLRPDGTIASATPQCVPWLASYCGERRADADRLPALLRSWMAGQRGTSPGARRRPLVLQRGHNRLLVRMGEHSDGSCDLLLQETNDELARAQLKGIGLTNREAEVLIWLAQGKANAEIALIVGARIGTINKHLEHIYAKLGVESRTAAANIACELTASA